MFGKTKIILLIVAIVVIGGGKLFFVGADSQTLNPADLNGDGQIDSIDFSFLVYKWLAMVENVNLYFNNDGRIDAKDIGVIMSNWLSVNQLDVKNISSLENMGGRLDIFQDNVIVFDSKGLDAYYDVYM